MIDTDRRLRKAAMAGLGEMEMERRKRLRRPFPSKMTRSRYKRARELLGAADRVPRDNRKIYWANVHRETTFRWRGDTFEATCAAMWNAYKLFHDQANPPHKCDLMLHALRWAFGISKWDAIRDHRDTPISTPRLMAVTMLYLDNVKVHAIHRAFKKDRKSINYMIKRGLALLEGMIHEQNIDDWGFASLDKSTGRVSLRLPQEIPEDRAGE